MARIFALCALGGAVGFMVGCGAMGTTLDAFFGVDASGADLPGSSTAESVGGIAGMFGVPWAGAGIGVLSTLWSSIRGRRYGQALGSTVKGAAKIRAHVKRTGGKITPEEVVKYLATEQIKDGTQDAVRAKRKKVEGKA